jgi:flotillin
MAQLPPVLESLTGVKFEQLLKQIPSLKVAMGDGRTAAVPPLVIPPVETVVRNS